MVFNFSVGLTLFICCFLVVCATVLCFAFWKKRLLNLFAVVYTGGVLLLTLLPLGKMQNGNVELITASGGFNWILLNSSIEDIMVNFALLMPLGIYSAFVKKPFLAVCLLPCLSVAIEALQTQISSRTADVNDLVFNILGAVFGVLVGMLIEKTVRSMQQKKKQEKCLTKK